MNPLDDKNTVRITIDGADPGLVERTAWALTRVWHTGDPSEPTRLLGARHSSVSLYARPDEPSVNDGPQAPGNVDGSGAS